jgi:sugar transferase EpsL
VRSGGAISGALKRLLDVAVSAAGLLALWPIMAAIALLVRLTMGRPVLFRHTRPGLNEKPFKLYKFRTMTAESGPDGELLPDGERLTRVGRLLRRWSLDELPQLWNVLRGDMSLVGPRPLLMEYLELYTPEQRRRHEVKPGITGWAQVNGRNLVNWELKLELDVWYADNWSPWLDLSILAKTLWLVLTGRGIGGEGGTRFMGSKRPGGHP